MFRYISDIIQKNSYDDHYPYLEEHFQFTHNSTARNIIYSVQHLSESTLLIIGLRYKPVDEALVDASLIVCAPVTDCLMISFGCIGLIFVHLHAGLILEIFTRSNQV